MKAGFSQNSAFGGLNLRLRPNFSEGALVLFQQGKSTRSVKT
jgi:hypothetical protein